MIKFGRNYKIKFRIGKRIETSANEGMKYEWQEEIIVGYPLTLQFQVARANFAQINNCTLQIMNLNEDTRAKLFKDSFDMSKVIEVAFYAGYGDDTDSLPCIYIGEIKECFSWKRGEGTDFLTEIRCLTASAERFYSYSNRVFSKGSTALDIIKTLCSDIGLPLKYYSKSIVDNKGSLTRDIPFIGNSYTVLSKFVTLLDNAKSNVVIDNNAIYILGKNDVIPSEGLILTPEAGLLGYPKRREQYIEVEMLFEPRIQQCSLVALKSEVDEFFNGAWKCVGFIHSGIISGAVNGDCKTKIALFTGSKNFNEAIEVDNGK